MSSAWSNFMGSCESRISALARSCFLGRQKWRQRCRDCKRQVDDLRDELQVAQGEQRRVTAENEQLRQRLRELEIERARPQPCTVPLGDPPRGQQYGEGLIALSVNLARRIGLRPTEHALPIFFQWLGVPTRLPKYPTIRLWMQRIGLARMNQAQSAKGGIWMVDITQQIGLDRVLAVARVPEQPKSSTAGPLRRDDLEILALTPGRIFDRQEVTSVYRIVEHARGTPRAVLIDGAC